MANGDLIQPLEPFTLGQDHVDELGIRALNVGQHEQLLHRRVFAHVAFEFGVGVAPLFRRLAKERHVENIRLAGVGDGGLARRDFRRDEVCLDGIGVDAVIELGESAVEIPRE